MKILKRQFQIFLILIAFGGLPYLSFAQTDTVNKKSLDNYLQTRRGLLGKLIKNIMIDTSVKDGPDPQRNDVRFQIYKNKIIRNIDIERLNFGTLITDTAKKFSSPLIRLANKVHHKTLENVIANLLFFSKNDRVQPFLLADNERQLRDQPYLQDARITIKKIPGKRDSVDIVVYTKDVLSIGAEVSSLDLDNTEVAVTEENLGGRGDRFSIKAMFDQSRLKEFGYGAEYIRRNISGTFIDGYIGFQNFNRTINGKKEENTYYIKLIRPLVNPYIRWTYALEVANHKTSNMYSGDSVYVTDNRYAYNNFDIWAGWNFNAHALSKFLEGQRLRGLIGLRFLTQKFKELPEKYIGVYDSRYSDITGVLSSLSVFRQDFYKTQFIYGLGRNEDVPEGMDISLTTGWITRQNRSRPYLGMKFERYYFTTNKHYLNFTARVEGFLYQKKIEDITALINVSFFNRLKNIGTWKQRTFLSAGFASQINSVLTEPLLLESQFGLPEFKNGGMGGYIRTTVKGESVFYIPGSIASFRFAPFIFYNTSLFTPNKQAFAQSRLYTSIGAGLRTRNESLIFGTLEVRAYFFPRKNFDNQSFRIDFNSNLKFKYNSQFIKRPEFIQIN